MATTAIVGLGNTLHGDDGTGSYALAELAKRTLPDTVRLMDGGVGGIDIMYDLERFDTAIIIDAIDGPHKPGAIVRLEGKAIWEGKEFGDSHTSLHQGDFLSALRLAQTVGLPVPPYLVFYGIQVGDLTPYSCRLSDAVSRAIPIVLDKIEEEVLRLMDESPESLIICAT